MDAAKHIFGEEEIFASLKQIKNGQNSKLGFAIEPRVKVASIVEYEKEFSEDCGSNREDFKSKRKRNVRKIQRLCAQ